MTEIPPYLSSFVLPVEDHQPERVGALDLYLPKGTTRAPAILFVHGGPGPPDMGTLPRDWPLYRGYGAAAAARGVVGAVADHRLIRGFDQLQAASDDVEVAVGRLRSHPAVDPKRIAMWFFSGAGLLAGEWLDSRPEWLRGIALTYPMLVPPDGVEGLTSSVEVIQKLTDLPVLLTRAGLERESLARGVEEFVVAAEAGDAPLEIIEVPNGRHSFDHLDHTDESRDAVTRALDWTVARLTAEPDSRPPVRTRPTRKPAPRTATNQMEPSAAADTIAGDTQSSVRRTVATSRPASKVALPVTDATRVVTKHLDAFVAKDLDAVLGTFAPNAQVHGADGSVLSGRRALREYYASQFEAGGAEVEVVSRIAEGEWVVDHQTMRGPGTEPLKLIVVHRVHAGSIAQVQFLG